MKPMLAFLAALLCISCGTATRRESMRTVAAFDVPLPNVAERHRFLAVLRRVAAPFGYHVDAATDDELLTLSEVSPLTMNAAIWRGEDAEVIGSAMNHPDTPASVWITFARGENPARSAAFRRKLMPEIIRRWPATLPLPIMPTGAIPNPDDMLRTPSGYVVKPSERWRYEEPKAPPAAPK